MHVPPPSQDTLSLDRNPPPHPAVDAALLQGDMPDSDGLLNHPSDPNTVAPSKSALLPETGLMELPGQD